MPIRKVTRFMRQNPRMALGAQIALTMLAHSKGQAQAGGVSGLPGKRAAILASLSSMGIPKPVRTRAQKAVDEGRSVEEVTSAIWDMAVETSKNEIHTPPEGQAPAPMTYEQVRLWTQAYNAGPYALLRNKGNVPYKETQNYTPRVMKYYKQDLSNSPYEPYIQASAKKYGLDPQLIRAVMKTESDFNNKTVSHAGARGLMQVMPVVWKDIAKRYGIEWDYMTGVFEPEKNIEVACAYLAWLRYDFLPRHFAAFEQTDQVPKALVRDKAPPRSSPRIVTEVAQAASDEHKSAVSGVKIEMLPSKKQMVQTGSRARSKPGATMTRPAKPLRQTARAAARDSREQGG